MKKFIFVLLVVLTIPLSGCEVIDTAFESDKDVLLEALEQAYEIGEVYDFDNGSEFDRDNADAFSDIDSGLFMVLDGEAVYFVGDPDGDFAVLMLYVEYSDDEVKIYFEALGLVDDDKMYYAETNGYYLDDPGVTLEFSKEELRKAVEEITIDDLEKLFEALD